MTAEQFKAAMGREPMADDLERANCPQAGTFMHWTCGVCEHGRPTFACRPCFIKAVTTGLEQLKPKEDAV